MTAQQGPRFSLADRRTTAAASKRERNRERNVCIHMGPYILGQSSGKERRLSSPILQCCSICGRGRGGGDEMGGGVVA